MKHTDDFPDYHSYMETHREIERRQFWFVVKLLFCLSCGIAGMAYHLLTR